MKLYLHVSDKSNPGVFDTLIFNLEKEDATLQDLFVGILKLVPQGLKLNSLAPSYRAQPFSDLTLPASSVLVDNSDLFVEVEKPVTRQLNEEELSQLHFEPITKYKFYDNEDGTVRVTIELKGLDKHPKDKIVSRFLDRSFEIKLLDFEGKNLNFAVPKLQCKIIPEKSKFWVTSKGDKIIVSLHKVKKDDNWYSLFRTKAIGDNDD